MFSNVGELKNVCVHADGSVDDDFFVDYESGRRVFDVVVFGFSDGELEELGRDLSSGNPRGWRPEIRTLGDLELFLGEVFFLWSKPYVVVDWRDCPRGSYAVFKDRGLRFRSWSLFTRFRRAMKGIRFKFKLLGNGKAKSNVMSLTVTVKYMEDINEAFRVLRCRFRSIIRALRRIEGRVEYIWVLELTGKGMPHLHVLLYKPEGYFKLFKYKGVWRYELKKVVERSLRTEGFFDMFGFESVKEVRDYLAKYLRKGFSGDGVSRELDDEGRVVTRVDWKKLTLFVCRALYKRPMGMSRYFSRLAKRPEVVREENPRVRRIAQILKELDKWSEPPKELLKELEELLKPDIEALRVKEPSSDLIILSPNLSRDGVGDEVDVVELGFELYGWFPVERKVFVLCYVDVVSCCCDGSC